MIALIAHEQLMLSLTTFGYGFERKSFGPYPSSPRYTLFLILQHNRLVFDSNNYRVVISILIIIDNCNYR